MTRKLLAIACGAPFVVRSIYGFITGDYKAGVLGLLFAVSNIIIFW